MPKEEAKRRIQLQDGRKIPFFWIESAIVEKYLWEIGPDAFAVYAVLCKHASNTTQLAWPSQQTIADLTMLSRNTVKKAIRTLKKAKLISVKKEGRPGREHNIYTLLAAKIRGRTGSRRDRGHRMAGSPHDSAGLPHDPAGSRRGHELDVVELDELNESKHGQGIANAMACTSDLNPLSPNLKARKANSPIPAESFEALIELLKELGISAHKRNCGALRELWNVAIGSPEERERQCQEAIETAAGMSIEHAAGVFAFALDYLRNEGR